MPANMIYRFGRFCCLLLSGFLFSNASFAEIESHTLFPICAAKNLCGVMDQQGNIIVEPQFHYVKITPNNHVITYPKKSKSEKFSVLNSDGEVVIVGLDYIHPQYTADYFFAHGADKWHIYNWHGQLVSTRIPRYSKGLLKRQPGVAFVTPRGHVAALRTTTNGDVGLYNVQNDFYLTPVYNSVYLLAENQAYQAYANREIVLIDVERKKVWDNAPYRHFTYAHGVLVGEHSNSTRSKPVFDIVDRQLQPLKSNLSYVSMVSSKQAIIREDKDFEVWDIPVHDQFTGTSEYDQALPNSLHRYRENDLYGYIDNRGKRVTPAKYFIADEFSENNRYKVEVAYGFDREGMELTHSGVIGQNGEVIIPIRYDYIMRHRSYTGDVFYEAHIGDQSSTWYNQNGEIMWIQPSSHTYELLTKDRILLMVDTKWGIVDAKAEWVVMPQYAGARAYYPLIMVTDAYFDNAYDFMHYINLDGQTILKASVRCNQTVLEDHQAQVRWPQNFACPTKN